MRGRRWNLPALPPHPQREVIDAALEGSYRRIRFTTPEPYATLAGFFGILLPLMMETMHLMAGEKFDVKVCPFLILLMRHLVSGEEREEKIYLALKASVLSENVLNSMEGFFEERLDAFTQRGSGFSLKAVEALEWDVVQFYPIPFLVGHGKVDLPYKLAAKKAVVNVEAPPGESFK